MVRNIAVDASDRFVGVERKRDERTITRVEDLLCNALRLRAFSWNIATPWAARCNWSHDIYLRNE